MGEGLELGITAVQLGVRLTEGVSLAAALGLGVDLFVFSLSEPGLKNISPAEMAENAIIATNTSAVRAKRDFFLNFVFPQHQLILLLSRF